MIGKARDNDPMKSPSTLPGLPVWLVDGSGNVASSAKGLSLLDRIRRLLVPLFTSTEEAVAWGSKLNAGQRVTLLDIVRTAQNAAAGASSPQGKVDLATRSQLLREAGESFGPVAHG